MMKDEGMNIELRSEEVQEVMGQIPAWIVRWGITLLFLVVVALLVGSCFFKYPDVITADGATSRHGGGDTGGGKHTETARE